MSLSIFRNVTKSPIRNVVGKLACNKSNTGTVGLAQPFYRRYATDETQQKKPDSEEAKGKESSAAAANTSESEALKKAIEEKDAKIKELRDHYLRALAEAENVRTRSRAEIENVKKFAHRNFSKDLLDTVDVLNLALKNIPKEYKEGTNTQATAEESSRLVKELVTGFEMTKKNMLKVFEKYGVVEFNPMGQQFDATKCHAVFMTPIPHLKPGEVFVVEKTGFLIHDTVLRAAQVGVVADTK